MNIDLDFITPIYTAKTKGRELHVEPSAIVGGLRWWYEALVRARGGFACSPTDNDSRCPQGPQTLTEANVDKLLCPVCKMFGATGWRRRFDLVIDDGLTRLAYPPPARNFDPRTGNYLEQIPDNPTIKVRCDNRGFFFNPGRLGRVSLSFIPRYNTSQNHLEILDLLLAYIGIYGGLGAHLNLGYGLFNISQVGSETAITEGDFEKLYQKIDEEIRTSRVPTVNSPLHPNANDFFYREVTLAEPWYKTKDFCEFKRNLRSKFRTNANFPNLDFDALKQMRHYYLGFTSGKSTEASKIKMTLFPHRGKLKIWGWISDYQRNGVAIARGDIISVIDGYLLTISRTMTNKDGLL